jgi:large subunit ribosomal protein L9
VNAIRFKEIQQSDNGETKMEVILLERVAKLGQMGDVVRVKDGFARNFLLPQGKALRATKESKARFEGMKVQLEANNLQAKGEAEGIAGKLNGKSFIVVRQASDVGQLFGSVSARDIAALATEGGFTVERNQIQLQLPIKNIGLHTVPIALHPEVEVTITINVARNADEAERQARGENVTQRREQTDEEAAAADAAAFFEKPEDAAVDQGKGEDEKTD